jgi:hypothetical protein
MSVQTGPSLDSAVDQATAERVWQRWLDMWNGDPEIADEIIADGLQMWYNGRSAIDASHINNPEMFKGWVKAFRTKFDDMTFSTHFGPLVAGDMVTVRWYLNAVYNGNSGFPDDVPGQPFTRAGVDIWRITDGRVQQCWSMSTAA